MKHSSGIRPYLRWTLAGVLLLLLAACSDVARVDDLTPSLAPQASGSFSGGSLLRGSVIGEFHGTGIGNLTHTVQMTVAGKKYFECENHGGNVAPGQSIEFIEDDESLLDGKNTDRNGRFTVSDLVVHGPEPLEACNKKWTLVEFLQVRWVRADLYELPNLDTPVDTYAWICEDPAPVEGVPLSSHVAPELVGPEGVCRLVPDSDANWESGT